MTEREKLIALIANGVACPDDRDPFGECCDSCRYEKSADCSNERLADHLIAHGVTVQGWIPVTERLPEVGSRVLACGEKGGVFLVKAEGKTTGFGRMDGASKYRSFTHWMPLPQPPKGE